MKRIVYSNHLEFRLKIRAIPYELPEEIFRNTKEKYYDRITKNKVAVKRVFHKNRLREIMVAYEENTTEVKLITIHPLKFQQKFNRIKSKRWQKL